MLRVTQVFVLLSLFLCVFANSREPVVSLPGLSEPAPFSQWAGYITVNTTYQRAMYYWFMESQNNPSQDPIVLWLQGGPGCSGIWAIFEEHGPFHIESDFSLSFNSLSWNTNANVIYVDAPCGVGFSYSNITEGLNTNDNQTAQDNYNFLQGFFDEFPEFSSNKFYITGESYGGVYVPTLSSLIVSGPDAQLKSSFSGIMVGNPVINCPQMVTAGPAIYVDNYYYHGLISFVDRQNFYNQGCNVDPHTPTCIEIFTKLQLSIGNLDGDNLYQNYCTGNATLDILQEVPDCNGLGYRTEKYLNTPSVQSAIHAVPRLWVSCNLGIVSNLNYTQLGMNMLTYYEDFFTNAPNLRILIYSGDIDIATVPHANTQFCLSFLPSTIVKSWAPWTVPGPKIPNYVPDHESKSNITAGYVQVYNDYTYATVKGAGHEVPLYQPYSGFYLFNRFIVDEQTP